LREKGIAKAAKKANAIATEGVIKIATNGNHALIVEINSQTDFVAMSDKFITLSNEITQTILHHLPKTLELALHLKTKSGATIEEACTQLTATIGEKTGVRRFQIIEKQDNQSFAHYVHNNNKIGVLLLLDAGGNPAIGRDVAMHAAAMNPKFLNKTEVDQT
jgi:elongation factor Ts